MKLFNKKPFHQTRCYCPICKKELVGTTRENSSFVSDTGVNENNVVEYRCQRCGCISHWNFDLFPIPVLIAHQDLSESFKVIKDFSAPKSNVGDK